MEGAGVVVVALNNGFTLLRSWAAQTEVYATWIQWWPFCGTGVWDYEDAEEFGRSKRDGRAVGAGAGGKHAAVGEKALAMKPGTFGRGFMKWAALRLPMSWPHGTPTMPEMDQEIGGTRPGEFESDMRELRRLFERFTREPRDFAWRPHPIFLEMSEEEWMRWGYLHMDHHLRQFGV